jgi:DNA mismatch repair protein MutS2
MAGDAASPRLLLVDARHPVLEAGLRAKGASPVPLTLEMPARGGVLVLSGPNAGGKTVALKTIGLLALMNQAGLPVPAREASLPVFRQVMADIGDHQSILESLSTFSARMVRVAQMSRDLIPPALVLVDEVGAGTDPEEAGALAVSIVDHFRRRGASVVATTHHEALKTYAGLAEGAVNAAMEIDEETMRPTYRLTSGMAGRSGGVDLAERVGLPPEVVAEARSRLSAGHREGLEYAAKLKELAATRQRAEDDLLRRGEELEQRRRTLEETLAATIESARERWSVAIETAIRQIDEQRERFIAGIKDRAVELQVRSEARRQTRSLREQLEQVIAPLAPQPTPSATAPDPAAIRPGMRVRLSGMEGARDSATVESVDAKGRAEVLVRGKRMTVPVRNLTPISQMEPASASPGRLAWTLPPGVKYQRGDKDNAPFEINFIGARVEEALERLDKFLDDAYLAGHTEVRIVHGHGTGRLRAAVRRMLADHPHVESFAAAEERSGGTGATVAVLRG